MTVLQDFIRKGGSSLLDLVFPAHCVLCGERLPPEEKEGLCHPCLSEIPKNFPPFCPTCGRNYSPSTGAPRCALCEGKEFPFKRLWFIAPYEGVLRETLHQLKYEGKKSLARPLSRLLTAFAKKYLREVEIDGVVAVPLFRQKERERQFNQSALFAKSLAESLSLPHFSGNLVRLRNTFPQVTLPKEKRFQNMKGAFGVKDPSATRGRRFLLVDDVVTTGATLTASAQALREAGAADVFGLALARG